ncbi:homoserine kinase [Methylococcaceae bacterium HT1]|nr:homoserine kinase [Methylococcaceae bacterium HT1]TXL23133.1 homoserine kinase [Methylococcaceae bacterium HT2]
MLSVYTSLSHTQIESFLSAYHLAPLKSYSGISAGIENTNYLLNTRQGDFVLTVYEHFNVDELSPYLGLLVQLSEHENFYPFPLPDSQQEYIQRLAGKPAALFRCLPGKSVLQSTQNQCQSVASALARFHLSSPSLEFRKKNPRNIEWMQQAARQISPHLSLQDSILLEDELNYQLKHTEQHIAQGIIHADLFKDNVLFVGDQLTGLLDFYAACCDYYLLDVAILLNDWCLDEQGVFERPLQDVFMQAYKQLRKVTEQEEQCLPLLLRRACLRFWLSRLKHKLYPRVGEITQEKDPELFKKLLLQHRQFYAVK